MEDWVLEQQDVLGVECQDLPGTGPALTDLRAERIRQYASEALRRVDALDANLGAVNADLLNMAYWLKQAIQQAMQAGPEAWMECEELLPAIESFLKVTKQIERFAKLETRRGASKTTSGDRPDAKKAQSGDSEV